MIKRFLYVYSDLKIGGIQTQIFEQSKELSLRGHKVTLLCLYNDVDVNLLNHFSMYGDVIFLKDISRIAKWMLSNSFTKKLFVLFLILPFCRKGLRSILKAHNCVHLCTLVSWFFLIINAKTKELNKKKIIFVAYHSKEVAITMTDSLFIKNLLYLLNLLPTKNLIATSDVTRTNISKVVEVDEKEIRCMILGVPRAANFIERECGQVIKVLSVGRLVSFKTYNFEMISVISRLRLKGYDLRYDIIGDGPAKNDLVLAIDKLHLRDVVRVIPTINYFDLQTYLREATCFIGSGTAIALAAGTGCPAIIGIESMEGGGTYGFLHDTFGANYHELGLEYPLRSYDSVLEEICQSSAAEYLHLCKLSYARSEDFSISKFIEEIILVFDSADVPTKISPFSIINLYTSFLLSLLNVMMSGMKAKMAKSYD